MTGRLREAALAATVLALAGLGLAVDAASEGVGFTAREGAAARHVERATFCPPTVEEEGASTELAVASASGTGLPVGVDPGLEKVELAKGAVLVRKAAGGAPYDLTGYGGSLVAGASASFARPAAGLGGARCSAAGSDIWFFPVGSSQLHFDERLLLYNPFPDEAATRISFFTATGERSSAGLSDIAVPAGKWEEVHVNEFFVNPRPPLSARVEAVRGRIVAWRVLFAEPESGPKGVGFALGAPKTSTAWYFPQGFLGEAAEEEFTILNPSDQEAVVTVSLTDAQGPVGAGKLLDVHVARRSSQVISLDKAVPESADDLSSVSAVVTSRNGVGIVAERALALDTAELEGISNEIGATKGARRWVLSPPVLSPEQDIVAIMNPGSKRATIDVVILTEDGPRTPAALSNLSLPAGRRIERTLETYSDGRSAVAVVDSQTPIVAERFAYSLEASDVADAMGTAISPRRP